ncbi:hypothetical protein GE061_015891 [Apolygus lucorum]|uniref:Uncharacterized protein n=1 Tax=Apolygus lucorum TaxID=248454 RepID=A0A8S9XRC4_APOLU|nr:hypothetical protein GE061_015891 [Apolygus lucorum]
MLASSIHFQVELLVADFLVVAQAIVGIVVAAAEGFVEVVVAVGLVEVVVAVGLVEVVAAVGIQVLLDHHVVGPAAVVDFLDPQLWKALAALAGLVFD